MMDYVPDGAQTFDEVFLELSYGLYVVWDSEKDLGLSEWSQEAQLDPHLAVCSMVRCSGQWSVSSEISAGAPVAVDAFVMEMTYE